MRRRTELKLQGVLVALMAIGLLTVSALASHAQTANYEYDELNRLIRVEHLDGTVIDYTYDSVGNRTEIVHSTDTTPPTGTITINSGATATHSTSVTLTLTCTDDTGCFRMQFSNDGTTYSSPEYYATGTTWTLATGDGTKTVYARFMDKAGNWSTPCSSSILVETAPPTTTASPAGGTYGTPQTVTLTCSDGTGSGCTNIYYTTDGSVPTTASPTYSSPISISSTMTLRLFAKDTAGNSESIKSEAYTVDTLPPTTMASPVGGIFYSSQSVTLSCSDGTGSGCDHIYYTTDGSVPTTASSVYSSPLTISSTTSLRFFAQDILGNSESPKSESYTISTGIDSYTKLMLHMDGTNGSTTFTDSSPSPKTVTRYGNSQISTAQNKFGGASGLFDGNGDYLSLADSDDWNFGNGDFTIDFWVRFSSLPANGTQRGFFYQATSSTYEHFLSLYNGSGTYYFNYGTDNNTSTLWRTWSGVTTGVWYHVALIRNGSLVWITVDGVQLGAAATAVPISDIGAPFQVGYLGPSYCHDGWIDEFRVSKGIARWTGNFTPPGGPYAAP